ncbi:MAG: FAD-dependent oxidoreductase [Porticoccaceae bacterium]
MTDDTKDTKNIDTKDTKDTNQSRRKFLGGATSGLVATGLATSTLAATGLNQQDRHQEINWDSEVDILVVGGGAAGCSAAITANALGNQVMIIEKAPVLGGTAAKSVGGVWVPNNKFMREAGFEDKREDCLKYMIRLSFPTSYNPETKYFGAEEGAYRQMERYYDNVNRVIEDLEQQDALQLMALKAGEHFMPDYFAHLPENKAPAGRALVPSQADGSMGNGAEMMRRFGEALREKRIPVKTRHRAKQLIQDEDGRAIGLVAEKRDGTLYKIKANRGVIFTTGGFTHNKQMRLDFLKGPVFGGCAAPTCEGDFVHIGTRAGAQLGNMNNAWWAQLPLEQALENSSVPSGIWCSPGDSMIQVNRNGERFFDEKFVYNERTQAHFAWDPVSASYPNLLSFMIYDQRTADQYAGFAPIPPAGSSASHVMSADTLEALAEVIEKKLLDIAAETAGFSLQEDFVTQLNKTIERFNQFASAGTDKDFSRGNQPIDQFFHFFGPGQPVNSYPNATMHPIDSSGPYYAVIMAAGTLDTKGGPKINEHAQVLDTEGQPIPGLYGAGNCIASFSGPAYWAGGATLGPALTFGSIAASHASQDDQTVGLG